ncbi:WGxxGxxG-CTERM domain-containing protein [Paenibacillus rhizovicinus]|uniref:WGxxGxxG-CTERM domain-containing protein n=2 Tax=Paenibacillus rhizovicinus TaxID=2704463 RepID=A0A6C0P8K7_9BACL|nr:WGxxGxxG-CTERM domain-containing protein [Paenibacillus rhizovicinus]
MNNSSYDNRSMNNYNATSTATGGNYRTNAVNDDNDFDWGWLGLLGLIGLAGMRSRNHDRNPERT